MPLAHSLGLPSSGYLRSVVWRSVLMWVLVRLVFIVFLWLLIGFDAALAQPTLGIPALLVWLDRKFFHEQILPANLGAAEAWFWGVSLVVVIGLDLLAAVVLSRV